MTEDIYEVDLQKLRDIDFPEIIKAEVQDFITWNFNEALFELSTLFNILERGVIFRVIDRCRDLNLQDTNLREICLCYENIAERLLNKEYKLCCFYDSLSIVSLAIFCNFVFGISLFFITFWAILRSSENLVEITITDSEQSVYYSQVRDLALGRNSIFRYRSLKSADISLK